MDESKTPFSIHETRIANALRMAERFGQIDGSHHRVWVIDQMVRFLTGSDADDDGIAVSTTDEYHEFVKAARAGEDGPNTYDWDTGIIP